MFQIVRLELNRDGHVIARLPLPLYELWDDAMALAEFDASRCAGDYGYDAKHDGWWARDQGRTIASWSSRWRPQAWRHEPYGAPIMISVGARQGAPCGARDLAAEGGPYWRRPMKFNHPARRCAVGGRVACRAPRCRRRDGRGWGPASARGRARCRLRRRRSAG